MNQTNPSESSILIPGVVYIRYSFETQSDSFSLDAQLNKQAERDRYEVIQGFTSPSEG